MKIFAGLKVLEKVLALLAAIAIKHIHGQSLKVQIDAVAKKAAQALLA